MLRFNASTAAEETRWRLKRHVQDKSDFSKFGFQPASPHRQHPRTAGREFEGFLIISESFSESWLHVFARPCRARADRRAQSGRKEPCHCSPLCLTYTFICQTRLTAPDPGTISQQAGGTRTAPYLVIQSSGADQRSPLLSSVPPLFLPPIFISSLQHPALSLSSFLSLHPYPSSLAPPQVIALHHCRAPRCVFASSRAPLFS